MDTLFIKGHNSDSELSLLLLDTFKSVDEVINVVDAIGRIRTGEYHCVFISDVTADIQISKAYNMLSKFMDADCIQVISKKQKPSDFVGNWIEVPKSELDLSKYLPKESAFEFQNKELRKTDFKNLVELSRGDLTFMKDILRIFEEDYPGFIKSFSDAIENRNIKNLGGAAHKLKAPLNLFGVNELDKQIEYLDDMGFKIPQESDWVNILASAKNITDSLPAILEEVKEELSKLD